MKNYKELLVWQKWIKLSLDIYDLIKNFPKDEVFGLTSQIKRCSISIPSNIAEWSNRNTTKEFINFLYISKGSLAELETQLIISQSLNYITIENYNIIDEKIQELMKMLNWLIKSLKI